MTDEENIKFKQLLKTACVEILKKRIAAAEFAMTQAQESANNEEKSSAGDKYETGRAMGQMERDMNARQLHEAKKELQFVEAIRADKIHSSFIAGSVALCNDTFYFMCCGLGSAEIDHKKIILLSTHAPLSNALLHKKAGETIIFNGREYKISEVY